MLDIEKENLDARINRAQSYLALEDFEKAKQDFSEAHEMDRSNQKVIW